MNFRKRLRDSEYFSRIENNNSVIFTLQNNSRENNFRLQSWNAIIFDIDDPLSKNHREIINY